MIKFCTGGGGGLGRCYFQYILLNEIQTMFSKVLTVDLCTDHTHYVKNQGSTVLRRNKNIAVEGRTVTHYFILVIRKWIDSMSLFRHTVWFSFSSNNFALRSLNVQHLALAAYSTGSPSLLWEPCTTLSYLAN